MKVTMEIRTKAVVFYEEGIRSAKGIGETYNISERTVDQNNMSFASRSFATVPVKPLSFTPSSPEKKIVARFRIGEIGEGPPDYLWEEFWDVSGLT